MSTFVYETLFGECIQCPAPAPHLSAFLEQLGALVSDPTTGENDVEAFLFSGISSLAIIFKDVAPSGIGDHPIARVVKDLLRRKHMACTNPAEPPGGELNVSLGHDRNMVFRVSALTELRDKQRSSGNIIMGQLVGWQRILVLSGVGGSDRLFALVPGHEYNDKVRLGPFFVHGPYRIADKDNNPARACLKWNLLAPW